MHRNLGGDIEEKVLVTWGEKKMKQSTGEPIVVLEV